MSFKITNPQTNEDREELLDAALLPTASKGWRADARPFGIKANSDALSAIAVFEGFGGGEASFHFAMIDGSAVTRSLVRAMILIAFHHNGLALNRVWANIAASNRAAIRAALAVGFDFEYRKRAGFQGAEDAIVLSMTREDPGLVAARPQANQPAAQAQYQEA